MNRKALKCAAVVLFLSFFVAPGFAEDSEVARRTLKALPGVYAIVEDLQPNITKYERYTKAFDLNKARLQRDVEQRLGAGGIKALSKEEWEEVPGRPVLYVNINTHENEKYWFAYDIKVELRQVVFLEANPAIKTLANTWSINLTGIANIGNLDIIRKDTGALVERFVQAYWAVNKK